LPRLFEEIKTGLAKTAAAKITPTAVGVDTWGVDYGWIGGGASERSAELLSLPLAYRDERTLPVMSKVERRAKDLYAIAGIQRLPFNTVYQLAEDLISRPHLPKCARRVLLLPDLLNWLLSGTAAAEYTICSTTGLLDAKRRDWSRTLLRRVGLPEKLFPKPVPPGTKLGVLRPELARETGAGPWPIYASAGHDTAAAVAAVPARIGDNWAYLSSGTWSLLGVELSEPLTARRAQQAGFTNEGGVGGKIRFLKNIMGLWLLEECRRIWTRRGKPTEIVSLCAAAQKVPAFRSLIDPAWPKFLAPADMPATIVEFCRKTGQKPPQSSAEFARCIFDGLALAYRRELDNLEQIVGRKISVLHVVGGGSQNDLLNRLTAQASGRTVLAGPAEATMLGNAAVLALAAGVFKTHEEAREAVRTSVSVRRFQAPTSPAWETAYARFLKISQRC
jgi:rhamnulokinase